MSRANHAACSLYRRFNHECKRLAANQAKLLELSEAYYRYRELLHEQEVIRAQIVKIFGVLGVHSPDVSEQFAKVISPKPLTSLEVRKDLKLWEILELFLSALDDKARVGEFRSFLVLLGIPATAQAVESAIKTHPELFQEQSDGRDRFLVLKENYGG